MDLLPNCFSLLDQTLYSNKDFQQLPEHTLGNNSWPCSLDNVHHRKSLSHILAEAASADSCHGQTVPRYQLAFPLNSGLVFSIKTQV